jgi:hypothetical protein
LQHLLQKALSFVRNGTTSVPARRDTPATRQNPRYLDIGTSSVGKHSRYCYIAVIVLYTVNARPFLSRAYQNYLSAVACTPLQKRALLCAEIEHLCCTSTNKLNHQSNFPVKSQHALRTLTGKRKIYICAQSARYANSLSGTTPVWYLVRHAYPFKLA